MARSAHKPVRKPVPHIRGLFDAEYDAITTHLQGVFYPKPAMDPTPDIAGYALGSHALVPAWRAAAEQQISSLSPAAVASFLKSIIPEQSHAFDLVGSQVAILHANYEARIQAYANDLLCGAMWCLPVYPQRVSCPGLASQEHGDHKLSESQMGQINIACGTNVDVHFIWQQEGAQWLRGYAVLRGDQHVNVMRSGLTIATGCDLGQKDEAKLSAMGYKDFNDPVRVKLRPYLNQPFITTHGKAYTDWNGAQVAAFIAGAGPIPILTKPEADLLDVRSFIGQINDAKRVWNNHHLPPAPHAAPATAPKPAGTAPPGKPAPAAPPAPTRLKTFIDLSAAWQTVLADWVFQHGPGAFNNLAYARAAINGDPVQAKRLLAATAGQRPQAQSAELANDTTTLTVDPPAAPAPPGNANRPPRQ
jgi:hypothetical protein